MASTKHELLKGAMNALSLLMYWKLPPINHLRNILETTTMAATLPWDVELHKLEFELFNSEWLVPKNAQKDRAMLYLHGGGYVIGSPHTHRALAGKIAKGIASSCLLIDYRKAPENPYPAALDDAFTAYTYLLDQGYAAKNIVLVGDSAGGGLAIALQYELKSWQMPLPLCTALLSPYLDLTAKGKSVKRNAKNDRFLDVFEMRRWAEMYAGNHKFNDPLISPLFGDPTGLPPILVQASKSEVLFDDSVRFVRKAIKAGVSTTFQSWEGLVHWWHMFGGMPEAKAAIGKIVDYINVQYEGRGGV